MIYPIHLPESTARSLVSRHFANEFSDIKRFVYGSTEYEFSAEVLETGDVNVRVWHKFDNGFAIGSGTLLAKTFRPYDSDQLELLKQKRMFQLATDEFNRRQTEQEMQQIMTIAKEMFGNDFRIQEE